jgi:hypothetical protein
VWVFSFCGACVGVVWWVGFRCFVLCVIFFVVVGCLMRVFGLEVFCVFCVCVVMVFGV